MRSGTSFFNWTLFKKDVARFWPIWASYLVLWLFLLPVNLLMDGPDFYRNQVGRLLTPALVFNVIYAPFAAMAVLSHLYSARSANFFGALPVRREGQFITKYLTGLSFLIVPDVIAALLAALVLTTGRGVPVSHAFLWLLTAAGEGFFFYSMAILLGLLVGHILALPAIYAVGNFLAVLMVWLAGIIARSFYPSFYSFSGAVGEAVEWLTPAAKFTQIGFNTKVFDEDGIVFVELALRKSSLWILAAYAGAAVLFTGAAFLLYRSRRLESAGDVVSVRAVKPVFKYLGAACAGMTLGVATSAILGEETLPFTVTIWTLIGCFAAQMILDKSFRVFKKWKGAAVLTVLTAAVFVVMVFDLTGYETRVPDAEDVRSVEVGQFYSSFSLYDDGDRGYFTVTDREQIAEFVALHAAAVREGDNAWNGGGEVTLNITYHTKHSLLSRKLTVSFDPNKAHTPGTVAAALEAIFADRELWRQIYGLDKLAEALAAGEQIDLAYSFYDYSYDGSDYGEAPEGAYRYFQDVSNTLRIPNAKHVRAILEALLEDFNDGLIGRRTLDAPAYNGPDRTLEIGWPGGDTSITVTPEAKRTYAAIQELLPEILEEQGLE